MFRFIPAGILAALDMLADTPKNCGFIARVRPVVEKYNNTGIRFEDDYLMTDEAVEWLSHAPREIEEIAKEMKAGTR